MDKRGIFREIINFLKWYLVAVLMVTATLAYTIHASQDREWVSTIRVTLYILVHYFPFLMLRPTVVFIITYINSKVDNSFLGTIIIVFFATVGLNMLFTYILPIELPIPEDAKAAVETGRGITGIIAMMLFTCLYFFCGNSEKNSRRSRER